MVRISLIFAPFLSSNSRARLKLTLVIDAIRSIAGAPMAKARAGAKHTRPAAKKVEKSKDRPSRRVVVSKGASRLSAPPTSSKQVLKQEDRAHKPGQKPAPALKGSISQRPSPE